MSSQLLKGIEKIYNLELKLTCFMYYYDHLKIGIFYDTDSSSWLHQGKN